MAENPDVPKRKRKRKRFKDMLAEVTAASTPEEKKESHTETIGSNTGGGVFKKIEKI